MKIDAETTVRGGVTLVTVAVRNDAPGARSVRIENRLDGPVLPPRENGVPAVGWDDEGWEGVVEGNESVALGYACPAPPVDPPIEPVDAGRAADFDGESAVRSALRELGDYRPPRAAVPALAGAAVETDAAAVDIDGGIDNDGVDDDRDDDGSDAPTADSDVPSADVDRDPPDAACGEDLPADVRRWLDAAEARAEAAERLTGASVPEATAVLSERGGLEGVRRLDDRLEADAEALAAFARRASGLAERADAVEVPLDALRRLA